VVVNVPASQRKRPGPKPRLSRDGILDVALGIMEADGPEKLSLRRLGDQLGVTARAVYGYFDSKEDLESALVERAIPLPATTAPEDTTWDALLLQYLLEVHDAILLHPGLAQLFVARSARNPATDRIREYLLKLLLEGGGLNIHDAVSALGTLSRYLLGCVLIADAARRGEQDEDIADDLPGEEFPILQLVSTRYAGRNSRESTVYGMRLIVRSLAGHEEAR
jgi:TetR/AcrR family transcriptional regulator, tetracycline repressor protein